MPNEALILKNSNIPLAIICGENDVLINKTYIKSLPVSKLWKNKIITINDASHCLQLEQSEQFNKLLFLFLNECVKELIDE